ncbi:MAG: anaerobic ribonucleoside-triphosphate reductase activating protein [Ruminococcus sp.]|nr:anaerobic ribonucleoside-triphosphate reductase activating protein [Ruminococcus sp.]
MKIKIAGTVNDSIVDGEGIRFVVFVQGCIHHCKGCHNPQTHSFDGGIEADTDELLKTILNNPLLDGVTFSGGEPFCQPAPLYELGKRVKEHGLNVVCYSGFTFEQLVEKSKTERDVFDLLSIIDVLIDGPFIMEKRNLLLKFRGSENQRIIDLPKSLAEGRAVVLD